MWHARVPHVKIIELEEPRDWTCAVANLTDHYDLNGRQYRPVVANVVEHESPAELLHTILRTEGEITRISLELLHMLRDSPDRATGETASSDQENTHTRANHEAGMPQHLRQLFTTFKVLLAHTTPPASPQLTDSHIATFNTRASHHVQAILNAHNHVDTSHLDLGATLGAFHDALQAITARHAQDLLAHQGRICTVCGLIGSTTVQMTGIQQQLLAAVAPQCLTVRLKTAHEDHETSVNTVAEAVAWLTTRTFEAMRLPDGSERELSVIVRNPPQYAEDRLLGPVQAACIGNLS